MTRSEFRTIKNSPCVRHSGGNNSTGPAIRFNVLKVIDMLKKSLSANFNRRSKFFQLASDWLSHRVLFQREMESWRAPLASITPYSAIQLHFCRPNAVRWRLAESAAVESTTGFKKEITWPHSPQGRWAPPIDCVAQRVGSALRQRLILQSGKPTGYEKKLESARRATHFHKRT